jgi:AcrR family transcriptional regulator
MRSVNAAKVPDLTGRARIRDAALALFGRLGYDGTGMRVIAAEAGVSPALVVHHFGSKEGLRKACDEYVSTVMRETKQQAMTEGPPPDPLQLLRTADDSQPLLRYLARMLVDGSPGVADLVDAMVADAVDYMEAGVESGYLKPSEHPYERAVLLCIWQLGAVALHEHVKRLMGVDLVGDPGAIVRWGAPAVEVLTNGLFADERWKSAVDELANVEQDEKRERSDGK